MVNLFALAADRGNARAFLDLAWLHERGELVERDLAQAYIFARFAELGGVNKAPETVARLRARLGEGAVENLEDEVGRRRKLNGL